jgi:hypothetical protein
MLFIASHCARELLMKSSMNRKKCSREKKAFCASIETQLKFNVEGSELEKVPIRKINIFQVYVGFQRLFSLRLIVLLSSNFLPLSRMRKIARLELLLSSVYLAALLWFPLRQIYKNNMRCIAFSKFCHKNPDSLASDEILLHF